MAAKANPAVVAAVEALTDAQAERLQAHLDAKTPLGEHSTWVSTDGKANLYALASVKKVPALEVPVKNSNAPAAWLKVYDRMVKASPEVEDALQNATVAEVWASVRMGLRRRAKTKAESQKVAEESVA
jgi:hypothetical protein